MDFRVETALFFPSFTHPFIAFFANQKIAKNRPWQTLAFWYSYTLSKKWWP